MYPILRRKLLPLHASALLHLAVMTVVGHREVVTVSNSAEFKSFLLIIDAPESTAKSLSSGSILGGEGRDHFSVGEKKVVLCFSF